MKLLRRDRERLLRYETSFEVTVSVSGGSGGSAGRSSGPENAAKADWQSARFVSAASLAAWEGIDKKSTASKIKNK